MLLVLRLMSMLIDQYSHQRMRQLKHGDLNHYLVVPVP